MPQLLYRIIYSRSVNYLIRNLIKRLPFVSNKIKIPPSGRINVTLDTAQFYLYTNQTCFVSHLIFWNGPQKFEYTKLFMKLIKDVNTFYDIGANIGYYSILGAKLNPNLKVISFEPAIGPQYYLKTNISKNDLVERIQLVNKALSNKEGRVQFQEVKNTKYTYLKYNLSGESNLVNKQTSKEFITVEAISTMMDNLDFHRGIPVPELIKIDTEGAELLVLQGGLQTIKKHRPIVICEILTCSLENSINHFFKDIGSYNTYGLKGDKLILISDFKEGNTSEYADFLFCPKEKEKTIHSFIH